MKSAAIFGAGRIGRIHASNLAALSGVQLQAVCDPVATAAAGLAQQLCARVSTIEAVLADKSIELLGSAGMLQCGNHTPGEVVQWDAHGVRGDKPENFFLQRHAAANRLEITHFFECLQSGSVFRTTIADGVAAQVLADAAAQSCQSGQAVTF